MATKTINRGLGKGFESLLPSNFNKSVLLSKDDRIEKISIDKFTPNPNQPRRNFDDKSLNELAASIKRYGIIQPILVSPSRDDNYSIVAGERRWRAAKIAGLKNVPAIVKNREELEQLEVAIIENVQRVDLNPLEQAISVERLHQQFGLSYAEIGNKLGKANTTVTNIARLVNLPDKAKKALMDNRIVEGHARQILAISDPKQQDYLLNLILKNSWTVQKAEQFVIGLKSNKDMLSVATDHTKDKNKQTKLLSKKLKTDVTVKRMAHGGKIEIRFKDDQDLERIVGLF